MRASFLLALLAVVACDMRWDGKKTYGELEKERGTDAVTEEAVQLTSAQIEAQIESTFQPFSPPKYQDEKTLWRIGRRGGR